MTGIRIKGTGRFLPDRVVTNDDFTSFLDTSDEWIRSHTGISKRHIAVDEPVWYMAAEAGKQALEAAGITAAEVDLIIGTTVTSEYRYPSIASLAQGAIGATNAFCFDVSAACTGSVMALDMARRYLCSGDVDTVLVLSSEALTQGVDFTDRSNCVLFGDGAGALVVQRSDAPFAAFFGGDGMGAKHLYNKMPRTETPFSQAADHRNFDTFEAVNYGKMFMDGHDVYRFATRAMPKAVKNACAKLNLTSAELDLLIPHQANMRIIEAAAKYMKLPIENVYVNIQNYANTSSATIPIALDECVRSGRLREGDNLCLVGFGSGLVYGAVVFEYRG